MLTNKMRQSQYGGWVNPEQLTEESEVVQWVRARERERLIETIKTHARFALENGITMEELRAALNEMEEEKRCR